VKCGEVVLHNKIVTLYMSPPPLFQDVTSLLGNIHGKGPLSCDGYMVTQLVHKSLLQVISHILKERHYVQNLKTLKVIWQN